jgi:glycosyltransferase involved in cell wall biosynthesis
MPKARKNGPEDVFVSVITVVDKPAAGVQKYIKQTVDLLAKHYHNYELVVVDNGMPAKELDAATDVLKIVPCIRIIRLSKLVSKDAAVFVGLDAAIGDYMALLLYGQDPFKRIPEFIEKNKEVDIVFGISDKQPRAGLFNRYGASLFYWYNKRYLGISIPPHSTYFMSFNRRAANALTRNRRHARHIRYMARQVGYDMDEIVYSPLPTAPQDKKSLPELIMSALELATNYSRHPLRLVTGLGLAVATINLFYGIYVVAIRIFKGHVMEGWTTLSLQAATMFFFLFLILAILSEYVGKILEESRDEPPYYIMDELNSKVSVADMTRRNIAK